MSYVLKDSEIDEILLKDLDATGPTGNRLSKLVDGKRSLLLKEDELNILLSEDGQIFELELYLRGLLEFRFIIRDGYFLDVLGNGKKLTPAIVGEYEDLDLTLFYP